MKTTATNRKIRVLLSAIRNENLIPKPEFQRRLVWSKKHKKAFIETVLDGYPFPEIYIAAGEVNTETAEGTELLVDGQQRLTTLYQYFTSSKDLGLGSSITPYSKLPKKAQNNFLEYDVVVRDLGKLSIDKIKEVFQRINSTQYSLNAMEVHNARFDGALKVFAEEFSQLEFFESRRIFSANEIRRMQDIRYALAIIVTVMSTYFNRDDNLEEFLERYNDVFTNELKIKRNLERVIEFIDTSGFGPDSRVWKKSDLFTLIVEVYRLLIDKGVLLSKRKVLEKLNDFYGQVNKVDSTMTVKGNVQKYYNASIQASNDRGNRIARGQIIASILSECIRAKSKKTN